MTTAPEAPGGNTTTSLGGDPPDGSNSCAGEDVVTASNFSRADQLRLSEALDAIPVAAS